jgi:hypothetical protein
MLADPVVAMQNTEATIVAYNMDTNDATNLFKEYQAKLSAEQANATRMAKEQGDAKTRKYPDTVVAPQASQCSALCSCNSFTADSFHGDAVYEESVMPYLVRPDI